MERVLNCPFIFLAFLEFAGEEVEGIRKSLLGPQMLKANSFPGLAVLVGEDTEHDTGNMTNVLKGLLT